MERTNLRKLESYIKQHPQAEGAKTLTEARRKAFGMKVKNNACKCGLQKCERSNGKSSHC